MRTRVPALTAAAGAWRERGPQRGLMPMFAAWPVIAANGSPWGVVAFCVGWNILLLIMIMTAPETLGVDMKGISGLRRWSERSSSSDPIGAR
jgi:hypothetical protein